MSQMLREVLEAPARVSEVLSQDWSELSARVRRADFVALVARGSSAHAGEYGRYVLGPLVAPVPTTREAVKAPVALAISQGGGSPDIVRALTAFRMSGALTIAVVNVEDSPLAACAEIVVPQRAGPELSLAATKSVLCSMACLAVLGGVKVNPAWGELDLGSLEGLFNVVVLGRGVTMCVALEVALKLKETCGIHASAFSAAEVLHGPREMVDSRFLVIAIGPACFEAAGLLEAQGARVFRVDRECPFGALYGLYGWIARAAVSLGRDPDRPRHLPGKIIQTQ